MGLTEVIYILALGVVGEGPVYELDPAEGKHEVSIAAAFWEDPSVLTVARVILPENQKRFEDFNNSARNFGFNDYPIWVRVNLSNSLDRRAKWILELADPLIDLFEIHIPDAFGYYDMKTGGDTLPFNHREIKYERFAFELQFEPGETKAIYLLFKPGYSSCKLTAYKPAALTESVHREQLFAGIFFGMLLLAIIYNFFIFASMRHEAFLDYVAYGLGLLGVMAVVDGYCAQFLLPGWPVLANRLTGVFVAWIGMSIARFILNYIGPENLTTGLVGYLKFCTWLTGASVLLAMFSPSVVGVPIALLVVTLVIPAIVWAMVVLSRVHHPDAWNFIVAWVFVAIGAVISIAMHLGLMSLNVPPVLPIKIASAFNLVLLSLGLAAHFSRIQRENAIQSEVLVKQEKLVQIGEMMGELSHELKNLNNASLLGMAVEQDRVVEILSFYSEVDSRWPDLAPVLFENPVGRSLSQPRLDRWGNLVLEYPATAGVFDELKGFMAELSLEDEVLDELMNQVRVFDVAQMVLLNHVMALARRLLMMNSSAGHANNLLESVLDYSRESDGLKVCDLAMVVESCQRLVAKKLEFANIRMQFHCSGQALAGASASDMHQVVLNLLGNAHDALVESRQAEKNIVVFVESNDEGKISLAIENNGPAIPLATAERIFERHYSTKGAQGSGIGLFVCRKLLTSSGGDITVDSSTLKTVFRVVLPTA
ncbi:MAG: sensor histidine kinase [Deltaproteobacteria bacterium]|nr:sensor histidine kinase [Deltaproteobacteria bacterium]MBT6436285.1 sensor histidine kinase [Deltaproteobacteria bacterium]MBT6492688.1 sensor histidine kinase [Deltaproteobacteria bacterium]